MSQRTGKMYAPHSNNVEDWLSIAIDRWKILNFFGLDSVIKFIQWNSISFGKHTECFHYMMYEVSAKGCKNSQVWSHAYIATWASSILQIHTLTYGCWWALSSIHVILLKWFHFQNSLYSIQPGVARKKYQRVGILSCWQKRATCLRTKRTSATGQSLISLLEVCNLFWQQSLCGSGKNASRVSVQISLQWNQRLDDVFRNC